MNLTKKQTEFVLSKFLEKPTGLNDVLEMVLNAMLYNERSEFLATNATEGNKANGYRLGKVFGQGCQLELRIPRDRQSMFSPVLLALFREQEDYLREVSFQLYGKGLTTRDIGEVMQTLYGRHYSKSSISNFTQSFYDQMRLWRERTLESHYLAIFIDGLQVKVRRNGKYQNECYYIILALKEDYTREVIAIETLPNESATGWRLVLQGLKERGLQTVGLVASDNLSGITSAVASVWKATPHQLCCVHLQRNLQARVRHQDKAELAKDLREVLSPGVVDHTREKAMKKIGQIKIKWKDYPKLISHIDKVPWEDYLTYLDFDHRVQRMLYTTNWIERFNRSARRTLKVRSGLPSEESVLTLITSVAIEKGNKKYAYPVYNFKFENKLKKRDC
ncbi:IS256 family transposase [Aquimarina sp. ERC-38]|uniref:IS256 family transposase n=1 Tax=Aquimarina sp. ERC-38 TaxID=2949996 RepID=UPI002247310D|nr:IS256 family transposase [Aquimarina sp. ERC-38]UZO81398.1 IS256 family transposase [Aquimarina sp. ERC-38]